MRVSNFFQSFDQRLDQLFQLFRAWLRRLFVAPLEVVRRPARWLVMRLAMPFSQVSGVPRSAIYRLWAMSILAFAGSALAQGSPPLNNVGQLFTPEVILALVFLLTIPMTTLVGTIFKLEGATASIVANVILNALAKGVVLVVTGQATLGFAVVATLVGIVLDKAIYDLIVRPKNQQIKELKGDVQ